MPSLKFKKILAPVEPASPDSDTFYISKNTSNQNILVGWMSNSDANVLPKTISGEDYIQTSDWSDDSSHTLGSKVPRNALTDYGAYTGNLNYANSNGALTTKIDPSVDFRAHNGSVLTTPYYYERFSTTYGGTLPALDQNVIDLVDAMGVAVDDQNKLPSFWLLHFSAPTTSTGPGDYKLIATALVTGVTRHASAHYWIKAIGSPVNMRATHINGQPISSGPTTTSILPSDGWTHVTNIVPTNIGYSYSINIRMDSLGECLIALPAIHRYYHKVHIPHHQKPLM